MTHPCPAVHCDRPASGAATICGACRAELERALRQVSALAADLDITLSRQTSKSGNGGRPAETPVPFNTRASEAGYVLRSTLVGWVRALHDHEPATGVRLCRSTPADTLPAMAAWLTARAHHLAKHPAADEAHAEITAAVQEAQRAVDRAPDRLYAGPCGAALNDGTHCERHLYARPDAHTITCPACNTAWDLAARREQMLSQVLDQLATAAQAAHILTQLAAPLTGDLVRQWAARGRIGAHGHDPQRHPLYRIDDVLDCLVLKLEREEAARAKREAQRAVTGREKVAS